MNSDDLNKDELIKFILSKGKSAKIHREKDLTEISVTISDIEFCVSRETFEVMGYYWILISKLEDDGELIQSTSVDISESDFNKFEDKYIYKEKDLVLEVKQIMRESKLTDVIGDEETK